MSTNIRWYELTVKSVVLKSDRKSQRGNSMKPELESVDARPQAARRGRPKAADQGQVVSCRLPAEELKAFDGLCAQLGTKSRSDGLRAVVRMASGFLEFSRADSVQLDEIRHELGKIGTNVNQIALAANRGRAPMVKAQWAAVEELRRTLPMMAKALSQVIAERRRQGVSLFRQFAEAQEDTRRG